MLTFIPISSFKEALVVRSIRNSCRRFMTRDTKKIGFFQQYHWWKDYQKTGLQWCYLINDNKKAIGYGLVRKIGDNYWLSGGLISEARGKGWGEHLFRLLLCECKGKTVFLEVRKSNKVAYKLYKKLGFKKISEKSGIIVMKGSN